MQALVKMEQALSPSLVVKRLESLGYVDKAVDIPFSIAPDTGVGLCMETFTEFVPVV